MSTLINTTVKPFKTTAFHKGEFIPVTDADLKGKLESSNQGNLDARKCATERYEEIEIRRLFGIEQTDRIEELEKEIEELKQAIHDKNALIV